MLSSTLTVASLAFLVTGASLARYSATRTSQSNTISAGTVSLGTPVTGGTCIVAAMLPGGSPTSCQLTVTYTGSPAWIGLDYFIATKAGAQTGATNLYHPDAVDYPMTVTVSSTSPTVASFVAPALLGSCPGAGASIDGLDYTTYSTCYETDKELVTTSAVTSGTIVFTITASLPADNGTNYQNGRAAIVLRAHAVQAGNNGTTSGCPAGAFCAGITSWN